MIFILHVYFFRFVRDQSNDLKENSDWKLEIDKIKYVTTAKNVYMHHNFLNENLYYTFNNLNNNYIPRIQDTPYIPTPDYTPPASPKAMYKSILKKK